MTLPPGAESPPPGPQLPASVLQSCGPYEPGTMTVVAVSDGCHFSYRPPGRDPPRTPVPGERVRFRGTTSPNERPSGEGLVVAVELGHVYGPRIVVLWSVVPRFFQEWDPQF